MQVSLLDRAKFYLSTLIFLDDKTDEVIAQIAMSVKEQNIGIHVLIGFTSSNCSKETLVVKAP